MPNSMLNRIQGFIEHILSNPCKDNILFVMALKTENLLNETKYSFLDKQTSECRKTRSEMYVKGCRIKLSQFSG